jgi:hypothetical protein
MGIGEMGLYKQVKEHRKFFEIRDEGTTMVVYCFKLIAEGELERHLIGKGGFGAQELDQAGYVIYYWPVDDSNPSQTRPAASYDLYRWHPSVTGTRTQFVAMQVIRRYWDILESGDVIDVQYALGETDIPKGHDRDWQTEPYDYSGNMEWMHGVLSGQV